MATLAERNAEADEAEVYNQGWDDCHKACLATIGVLIARLERTRNWEEDAVQLRRHGICTLKSARDAVRDIEKKAR